jgi:hypothetical protein
LYFNSEEQVGLTAKQSVEYNDEWLCEAYMKTDYSKLCLDNFKKTIRVYFSYLVFNGITDLSIKFTENKQKTFTLNDRKWKKFDLYEFFTPKRGTRLKQEDRIEGTIPLVTAGESNLGVKEFISNAQDVFESKITIDMFCNTYVHMDKFSCDDNIITLDCKVNINLYIMLFVSTIIYLDKYRYQYGRQYRIKNFLNHKIELPVNNEESPDWKFMEDFIKQLPYADRI